MKVAVVSRSGREVVPGGIQLADNATVDELSAAICAKAPKLHPSRQRLTLPAPEPAPGAKPPRGVALQPGKKLSDYLDASGGTVILKDLGPQVGWTTVFVLEYLGPLLVYPLFYLFPQVLYSWHKGAVTRHTTQTYALAFWSFHYAKRILETLFVHRFSHGTMPLSNLFKNCTYYWGFAAFVSYFVNHPMYTSPSEIQVIIGVAIGVLNELSNLYCHVILSNLRPPGSREYAIPRGFLFNFVTCANYTTEIYAWLGFNIATQTLPGYAFMSAGALQMAAWAAGKHRRLRKLFDGKEGRPKYPRRFVMLPPFY